MPVTEHRFSCTACGKCCFGSLPLTLDEAIARADRFPLAMALTPIKFGTTEQALLETTGCPVVTLGKQTCFVQVVPISFVPPSMSCPELGTDNLCAIHDSKPVRCRTMPLYPFLSESNQAKVLTPRPGWLCDTSENAPVIYKDQKVLERGDFDSELNEITEQSVQMRRYVDLLLAHSPSNKKRLEIAAKSNAADKLMTTFVSFLRYNKNIDIFAFARKQHPVLQHWVHKTAGDKKLALHNNFYKEALREVEQYISQ